MSAQQPARVFVESYYGTYADAQRQFRDEAPRWAAAGYQPTSQNWVEGGPSVGCVSCALIIVLFITIIGILLLPFIFLRRRKGTLTVTYSMSGTPLQPPA